MALACAAACILNVRLYLIENFIFNLNHLSHLRAQFCACFQYFQFLQFSPDYKSENLDQHWTEKFYQRKFIVKTFGASFEFEMEIIFLWLVLLFDEFFILCYWMTIKSHFGKYELLSIWRMLKVEKLVRNKIVNKMVNLKLACKIIHSFMC